MPKELQSDNEDGEKGVITESEHLMPYLMRYILDNKIGILPYNVQKDIKYFNIRDRVQDVEEKKITVASLSQ